MPKGAGNLVRLREDRGEYKVTIPRALVRALGLKRGDLFELIVEDRDWLRVHLMSQSLSGWDGVSYTGRGSPLPVHSPGLSPAKPPS